MTNRNPDAVKTAEKGLMVLPEKSTVPLMANLAAAEYNLGNYERAIKLNEKALSLSDEQPIRVNLGFCYYKAGHPDLA